MSTDPQKKKPIIIPKKNNQDPQNPNNNQAPPQNQSNQDKSPNRYPASQPVQQNTSAQVPQQNFNQYNQSPLTQGQQQSNPNPMYQGQQQVYSQQNQSIQNQSYPVQQNPPNFGSSPINYYPQAQTQINQQVSPFNQQNNQNQQNLSPFQAGFPNQMTGYQDQQTFGKLQFNNIFQKKKGQNFQFQNPFVQDQQFQNQFNPNIQQIINNPQQNIIQKADKEDYDLDDKYVKPVIKLNFDLNIKVQPFQKRKLDITDEILQSKQQDQDKRIALMKQMMTDFYHCEFNSFKEKFPENNTTAPNSHTINYQDFISMLYGQMQVSKKFLDWYFQAANWCLQKQKLNSIRENQYEWSKKQEWDSNIKFWEKEKQILYFGSDYNTIVISSPDGFNFNNDEEFKSKDFYFTLEQYIEVDSTLFTEYKHVIFVDVRSGGSEVLFLICYLDGKEKIITQKIYIGPKYDANSYSDLIKTFDKYRNLTNIECIPVEDQELIQYNCYPNQSFVIPFYIHKILHIVVTNIDKSKLKTLQPDNNTISEIWYYIAMILMGKVDQLFYEENLLETAMKAKQQS